MKNGWFRWYSDARERMATNGNRMRSYSNEGFLKVKTKHNEFY